jgi:hypothetical protein
MYIYILLFGLQLSTFFTLFHNITNIVIIRFLNGAICPFSYATLIKALTESDEAVFAEEDMILGMIVKKFLYYLLLRNVSLLDRCEFSS